MMATIGADVKDSDVQAEDNMFSPRRYSLGETDLTPLSEKSSDILTEEEAKNAPVTVDDDTYHFSYEALLACEYEDDEEFDPYVSFLLSSELDFRCIRAIWRQNNQYLLTLNFCVFWRYFIVYGKHSFKFVAMLPPKKAIRPSAYCLSAKDMSSPPITLVLDLDETLVHCSTDPMPGAHHIFPVLFHGVEYQVYVRKRPYFEEFLKFASSLFEVVVFTASQKVYADKLLDILDPNRQYVKHRVFRDSCVYVDGNYLKDLEILGRDAHRVVIIDNSPQAFGYQVDNGIPILSWFDDENDRELQKVIPFLKKLHKAEDVRPIIRQKFKFKQLIDSYKDKISVRF